MDFSLPYPDAMFADSPSMALDDDLDLFDAFGYPGLTGSATDILDPAMGPLGKDLTDLCTVDYPTAQHTHTHARARARAHTHIDPSTPLRVMHALPASHGITRSVSFITQIVVVPGISLAGSTAR